MLKVLFSTSWFHPSQGLVRDLIFCLGNDLAQIFGEPAHVSDLCSVSPIAQVIVHLRTCTEQTDSRIFCPSVALMNPPLFANAKNHQAEARPL